MNLTSSERDLLNWLSKEDFSQYGECHGKTLNALITKGLVQIHETGNQSGFITQGTRLMYKAVSLTDAGHTLCK